MNQKMTRLRWNGGLGWWAMKQCRGFMDFTLCPCFSFGGTRPWFRLTALPGYSGATCFFGTNGITKGTRQSPFDVFPVPKCTAVERAIPKSNLTKTG